MKYKILLLFVLLLFGCGRVKNITNNIANNTKRQIEIISKEIKMSTCKIEEKIKFQQSLEIIKANIDNINLACNTQKQVLNEKIDKLKIILGTFIVIFMMFLYLNLKRR